MGSAPSTRWEFTGGALCLDFVNTLADRPLGREESLASYQDLIAWSREARVLSPRTLLALGRLASRSPLDARAAFERAVRLRECLYRVFSTRAARLSPAAGDMEALNRALAEALRHLRLGRGQEGIVWRWADPDRHLAGPLWPVVRSAAELLTSPEEDSVRECVSSSCSWLFVDRSRTRRRRWCDMKTCGNRAKARRYYHRKRADRLRERNEPAPPDNAARVSSTNAVSGGRGRSRRA